MPTLGKISKNSIRTDLEELSGQQVAPLLADWTYASLCPTKCESCGATSGFSRRIFKIAGIEVSQYADDSIQNVLRDHFLKKHGIEHVFFRALADNLYVDSAVCSACKSTRVLFDISLRGTLWAAAGLIRRFIRSLIKSKAGS